MPYFTFAIATFIYNCRKCVWIYYLIHGNHFGGGPAGPDSHPNKVKTPTGTTKHTFL